ncbi:MAG: phosphate ABC transporter permease PstA [Chloroflexi bacterium]|nr:phosphate ABC transporter permease PstA [Chloroflexota bacterium]
MTPDASKRWRPRIRQRNAIGRGFAALTIVSTLLGIAMLVALLVDVFSDGAAQVDGHFLTSYPSRFPEDAGLRSALLGTLWLIVLTAVIAFPLGVGAAIYLEEYAPDTWLTRFIQLNIANLAGVPSVVYGLLGLGLFVRWFALGRSLMAGAMTMALLILPLIIVASREAIRAVPDGQREASYALGATRWQTVFRTVLPAAGGGILTGTILALARAIGETAPLITIGALTYIAFDPTGPMDLFTVLPIQIFNWVSLPQEGFSELAAGGIVILLIVLLLANSIALFIRFRLQRRFD